jgi:hypothetical protein
MTFASFPMPDDGMPEDGGVTARGALGLLARQAVLLALAALLLLLAILIAGRNAPRTSGDLVQLWIVPEATASAEVGLRNGIEAELDCLIVLQTNGGDLERRIEISPGQTYRESTRIGEAAPGSVTGARAHCEADGQRFNRQVWLEPGTTS